MAEMDGRETAKGRERRDRMKCRERVGGRGKGKGE